MSCDRGAETTPATAAMLTRNLLTARCMLAMAVLLAAAGAIDLPYTTTVEKSVAGYSPTTASSFVIPDRQCSGYIDETLLCGEEGVAGAVRVVVRESTSFPTVRINRHLRNVTILRSQDVWGTCGGQAEVDMYVRCLVPPPRALRRRRDVVGTLPTARAATDRTPTQ